MNIFNSLGSNYNFNFVIKALFAKNKSSEKRLLLSLLAKRFKGKAFLTYKARESLYLALKNLNLPKNSFVAITGFTCFVVNRAIIEAGFKPLYLDIDPLTLNFTAHTLLKALKANPAIKAVIIQNTLGFPVNIKAIQAVCKKHKLKLIEDLAHSTQVSTQADAIVLSFSQDKIIDAVSGGAVILKKQINPKLTALPLSYRLRDRLYPLLTYIIRATYPLRLGKPLHFLLKTTKVLSQPMNINKDKLSPRSLPNWYCLLARFQFKSLQENIKHRRQIALLYVKNIDTRLHSTQLIRLINRSTNIRYPIFVKNRQSLFNFLKSQHIYLTDTWYDAPIAPKKYLSKTDYTNQCPRAEIISSTIVNLPTHKKITLKKAKKLSSLINQWHKSQPIR